MASIMAASFGVHIDLFKENHEDVEKAGELIFTSTYAAEIDMLIPNVLKKLNLSLYPYLVNKFCYDVVSAIITQKNDLPTTRNNIMDVLLALKKQKENEEVKMGNGDKEKTLDITEHVMAAQVFIFFAAGFGNNALTMSYAMFRLAKNQEVQEKLLQEIDDVLIKYGGKVTYEGLKEMIYLDQVFSEVLRMNTIPHAVLRSAKKDYKIPGTDITIDKGTSVIVSPYAIHRDEKLYPDPDKFDPERFSGENLNRHSCAYIPFGAGPRSCIGRLWAKMQFCVGIVKVLSTFRVEPSEKTKIIEDYDPMSTLLATKGGIYVNLIRRKI